MHAYDKYISMYGRLPTERDPRYLELVRMSKYRISDFPTTQPGKCINCGASRSDGRKYIDIGVELEFYGIVEICSLCAADFARNLGLFRAAEVQIMQLEQTIEKLRSRNDLGEEIKNTVLHTFEQVREYFDGNGTDSGNPVPGSDSSSSVESSSEAVQGTDNTAASTKSGPVKSATVSGSKNVPKLTDLINTRKE